MGSHFAAPRRDVICKFSHRTCQKYDEQSNSWVDSGPEREERRHAAAALHPTLGLIITGGMNHQSTEVTSDGVFFQPFTPLPTALWGHCLVTLGNEHGDLFLAGGYTDPGSGQKVVSPNTYIYQGGNSIDKHHFGC